MAVVKANEIIADPQTKFRTSWPSLWSRRRVKRRSWIELRQLICFCLHFITSIAKKKRRVNLLWNCSFKEIQEEQHVFCLLNSRFIEQFKEDFNRCQDRPRITGAGGWDGEKELSKTIILITVTSNYTRFGSKRSKPRIVGNEIGQGAKNERRNCREYQCHRKITRVISTI